MKKHFISLASAAALLIASAAVVPANATESGESSTETSTLMPTPKKKSTKKTSSKKSTKKSTTKKSTSKNTTKSSKSTAASTTTQETVAEKPAEQESGSSLGSVVGGVLGGLLGGGSSSSSSSSTGGSLLSALTTIFDNSKTATADKIVGTWKYTEPAVVFESNNALKSIGGKVASAAIEKKLQSTLQKVGITKGKMKMTFDKDGNFTQTIGKKTVSGTYAIDGKNVVLTYSGGLKQMIGSTQLDGNSLLIVMEAGNLLKYAGTISKLTGNSTISSLGSLLSGYDGMELGLKLEK